ncbi:translocation/assembly module TamB domain-containing protein [Namhaeicola litoreus]|uniref:Translocation/assembly module TamB domain-containing protein n=1 Tax=Namhaeicola litoreus TaxID=1052145 RepID=A0ABW3Y1V5_9FLAO
MFLLSLSSVQTFLAKKITSKINDSYGTEIHIGKIDLSSLKRFELTDVLILDHRKDSMIYVNSLKSAFKDIKAVLHSEFALQKISLSEGFLRMKTYKGDSINNLTYFANSFHSDEESETTFKLSSPNLLLENIEYTLIDENKNNEPIVFYYGITGELNEFSIFGSEVKAKIRKVKIPKNHLIPVTFFKTDFLYSDQRMECLNTSFNSENSNIEADIIFEYGEGDMSDFNNRVKIIADFTEANLALVDLNILYDEFGTKDIIHFKTRATGTINDFQLNNLELYTERKSELIGDISIQNVLDAENFALQGDIDKIAVNYDNLKRLLPNLLGKNLPESLSEMGTIKAAGDLNLTKNELNANLSTTSNFGILNTDISLVNLTQKEKMRYRGTVELKNFKIGEFAKDPKMGKISLQGEVNGSGFTINTINTTVVGNISKYEYNDYTYKNIDVNGIFENKLFNGELNVNDPNLQMKFSGIGDFVGEINKFDFSADVVYSDFKQLNLYNKYEKSILKGKIDLAFTGNTFDNLIGEIKFEDASYTNENDEYIFTNFSIVASEKDSIRTIDINSTDIIEGQMEGRFNYKDLLKIAQNSLGSMYANYKRIDVRPNQTLDFNFNIYNKIIEVFYPKVNLAANTFVKGQIISNEDKIDLLLKSPKVKISENEFDQVKLQINSKSPLYNTILSIDNITTGIYEASNFNLVNVTLNDTLYVRTDFIGGPNKLENYDLSFYHTIDERGNSVVGIKKSEINFKNNQWFINENNNDLNKLVFSNNFETFAIDKITMASGTQKVELAGAFGGEGSSIDMNLEYVNLDAITPDIDSLNFDGKVNGQISLQRKDKKFVPLADLMINYFSINDLYYGDLSLFASGDENLTEYNFDIKLLNNDLVSFNSKGNIDFNQKPPVILAEVLLDRIKLEAFSPLGKDVLSNIRGIATGNVMITGNLNNPDFTGEIDLSNAGMGFPYLNVDYNFSDQSKIVLNKQTFDFQSITLTDTEMGTEGTLSGKIKHEGFKKWFLDLFISGENLLALNTEDQEGALYYGTALIEGETTIYGPVDDLLIDVEATTNPGTKFVIPLSDVSTVGNSNLIHFVNPDEEDDENDKTIPFALEKMKGLNLNFNLNVTKDAVAEIVIDKKTGSLLKGSGDGNLRLGIDMNGRFEMYGELLINNGEYLFKNIVSKNFAVQNGGTIIWNGDPLDANINIEALYKTKANPSVLLEDISSSRKIDVNLITTLSGSLSQPQFDFDIEIPTASSDVTTELNFVLANKDEKLTQFFSLLATGSFFNTDQRKGEFNSGAVIAGTVAEQASSILSNVLSSSNDIFQIGVDYEVGAQNRVENVVTDDQLGILVSGRIGNKVIVNGKVGVPVGANTQSSVVGEVELLVPLNEAETLMGKVYNRQNEIQFDLDSEGYTQGAGISYRFDFDNTTEFMEKIGLKKSESEKSLTKKQKDSIKVSEKTAKNEKKEIKQAKKQDEM